MRDSFIGAILGFAIGDALGMPVEGISKDDIRRIYGYVRDFLSSPYGDLKEGEWTDDTEQMIALAESILSMVYFDPSDFAERLKLICSNRIGPTTRVALRNLSLGVPWNRSGVESETCGSAMRVLPIGLVYSFSLDLVEKYSVLSSVVTHKGIAVGGAVAVAVGVACIVRRMDKKKILKEVTRRVKKYDDILAERIEFASMEDVVMGNSISVRDVVPLAFHCHFTSSNFEECALKAVNSGGDTDTIAAIACGLKGCEVGLKGIPERWVKGLKDSDRLLELADRLYELHVKLSSL